MQVEVVVMEIDLGRTSSRRGVAMEILPRGTLEAVEEDEDGAQFGSEERFQHPGQRRRRGPPFCQKSNYMLIVIGEIATEHQLQAARKHIERGECVNLFLHALKFIYFCRP